MNDMTTNAPEHRSTPIEQLCRVIATPQFQQKIQQALPPGVSLDRFTRTTLTALQTKPDLALIEDRNSLFLSITQAAQMGLMPDNREGAIVEYSVKSGNGWIKRAQFQPMVAGVIKRFAEAGVTAYAVSVHERDNVRLWNDDTGQHFTHEPVVFGERGAFRGVVAVARTDDGRTFVEALTLDDIDQIRRASKSKDREGNPTGPWRDWPDRMAQKSALHRLGRRVPIRAVSDAAERLAAVIDAERPEYAQEPQEQAAPVSTQVHRPRVLSAVAATSAPVSEPASDEPADAPLIDEDF